GVVALALGVGVGTHTSTPDGPAACADDWLADVWNEDVASTIASRFAQGPAFAQVSWTTMREGLDAHVNRLLAMRDEACAPADVPVDPELATRRFACLDERAGELSVVLGVLAEIEPKAIQDAVRVPQSLRDPRACDETAGGDEADPPDPRIASNV